MAETPSAPIFAPEDEGKVGVRCPGCSVIAGRPHEEGCAERVPVPGTGTKDAGSASNSLLPAAAIRPETPTILGENVHMVSHPEELLWRIAAFLDRSETAYARRNLRARIRKALDGGDWREELTDEEVERYG